MFAFLTATMFATFSQFSDILWWLLLIGYIVMLFCGLGSIIYAYIVLNKPGISQGCRSLILKRHAAGIIVFFITQFYIFVYSVYVCFGIPLNFKTAPVWQ